MRTPKLLMSIQWEGNMQWSLVNEENLHFDFLPLSHLNSSGCNSCSFLSLDSILFVGITMWSLGGNFKTKASKIISKREVTYSYTNFPFFVSKVDESYVAGFQNRSLELTGIYVVWMRIKEQTSVDTCLKEIGLPLQILVTPLHSNPEHNWEDLCI